jgi:hypothetical protein
VSAIFTRSASSSGFGALVIEGAVFKVVRGMVDHGSRHSWRALTGAWPGEERPDNQ